MKRILRTRFAVFLFSLVTSAAAVAEQPSLTTREVARIADAFALKQGVCFKCYKRPVVKYYKTTTGNFWTAYYAPVADGIKPAPTNTDFAVRVDEATRKASDYPLR